MGLRLYQAPVESDIQSKPAAEKTSAQARSTIRRAPYRSNNTVRPDRDRRRRHLAAAASAAAQRVPAFYYRPPAPPDDVGPLPAPIPNDGNDAASSDGGRETSRRAIRHMAARLGVLDDRVIALFGERWAHLHGETNPSPSRDDEDNDPSPLSIMAVDSEFLPRRRLPGVPEPYATSSIRSTQAPGHPSRSSARHPGLLARARGVPLGVRDARPTAGQQREPPRIPVPMANHEASGNMDTSPSFDGLGDRNRSLSPEGDNAWDTLLTTLTPDPQPPSVGSSFVSATASASAAASQGGVTNSSRTSFTGPDTAEESGFEPPCESGCENSDTDGDDDEEGEQNPLTRFLPGSRSGRRSYIDVTRNVDGADHPLDLISGIADIGGMQRIVSSLARRQDIPDEWWAEAGLSRTLSREASSS